VLTGSLLRQEEGVMGEFEIEPGKVASWADKINGYSGELKRQKGQVEDIIRRIRFKGDYHDVERALSSTASNLGTQQRQMKQYGGILENIAEEYKSAESGIAGAATPGGKINPAVDHAV